MKIREIYKRLKGAYGFLNWWPGETKDEILIGAILTQRTNWRNVERAINRLKERGLLSIEKICDANPDDLANEIKGSGFYREKAKRLKEICKYIVENYGSIENMMGKGMNELREELLSLKGIGNETADDILLYALEKPSFVVDAYTFRLIERVFGKKAKNYYEAKRLFEESIEKDLEVYKDYHAQIVEHSKRHCRSKPICEGCPLADICEFNSASVNSP
ncbi:MAG: endonuclease III domain-containing protein [Candidatus Micrarchaeaceae archaeon]